MYVCIDISHFTDHPDSIVSSMACIVDLNFFITGKSHCYIWRKLKRLTILILCTRLLEFVTLITLIASFLPRHASLI